MNLKVVRYARFKTRNNSKQANKSKKSAKHKMENRNKVQKPTRHETKEHSGKGTQGNTIIN